MMSPLAATSTPGTIEVGWTDNQIILFLARRRNGDSLPSNVITNINPFSSDPWNGQDNLWYLCNSKELVSPERRGEIRSSVSGYWKDVRSEFKIITGTNVVGTKTVWEFFGVEAPPGDNLHWLMFEYKLEETELQALDKEQDLISLCRVFCCNMRDFEEFQDSVVGNADGEYMQSLLLGMLEQEENIDLLESTTYRTEGTLAVHDGNSGYLRSIQPAELYTACDFSTGDFLELKDLCDTEFSTSVSDNSSFVSHSSDEYFDPEALLRDLEDEYDVTVEGCHTENKFSISGPQTCQMVLRTHSQGSSLIGGGNPVRLEEVGAASASTRGPLSTSLLAPPRGQNEGASMDHQDSKEMNSGSQRAGTSGGSVTKRVGRLAKIGMKYFCFS